jgi:hypothetical protein
MIKIETLFKNGSSNETLKKTYQVNQEEVYISFKKGMVRSDEYYLVERIGKNIRLIPTQPYLIRSHPEDPNVIKLSTNSLFILMKPQFLGRSPIFSLKLPSRTLGT